MTADSTRPAKRRVSCIGLANTTAQSDNSSFDIVLAHFRSLYIFHQNSIRLLHLVNTLPPSLAGRDPWRWWCLNEIHRIKLELQSPSPEIEVFALAFA
jgi:hypothetical protein